MMTDTHTYFSSINSFLGLDLIGVKIDQKNVINCVVNDYVQLMEDCSLKNSIIGQRCIIRNAVINNSIILPNTFINYHPSKDDEAVEITNSIVGGGGQFPTFFDNIHSKTIRIDGTFAVPDNRMQIMLSDLGISEADVKMCEQAFEVSQNSNKMKE
jgi:NDP-sugar pyrophosphorylase family protein